MKHHVAGFHVGMFVQSSGHYDTVLSATGKQPFIGTVKGLTVNAQGEPILVLHMIVRKFTDHKIMTELGYTAVENTHVSDVEDVFYERTGPMHPANVTAMLPGTYLGADCNDR